MKLQPRVSLAARASAVVLLTGGSLAAACSSQAPDDPSAITRGDTAQADLPAAPACTIRGTAQAKPEPDPTFYTFSQSDLPGQPGSIIKCERLDFDTQYPGYQTYRVMYRTTSVITQGGVKSVINVPATGLVYVPYCNADAGDGGIACSPGTRPVFANTHGLTGMRASCGPSVTKKQLDSGPITQLAAVIPNAVVAVPDYTGLGLDHGGRTPDVGYLVTNSDYPFQRVRAFGNVSHPFISLEGEGRATVDIVKAATTLPDARTTSAPKWFTIGQSQGGHAALATAQVVSEGYGVPMNLLGVIAGSPGSELLNQDWDPNLKKSLQAMVAVGLSLEDRDISASTYLTDKAMSCFYKASNSDCADAAGLLDMIDYYNPIGPIWKVDPFADPKVQALLVANSPGYLPTGIPTFIGQINGDPLIHIARTRALVDRIRGNGTSNLTYCEYDPIKDPNAPILLRMENHGALTRMFDGSPCHPYASGDAGAPADAGVISPVTWAASLYNASSGH